LDGVAVLTSGGLDSAVLLHDLAGKGEVFPIYVEFGLAWEAAEKVALGAYLKRLDMETLRPLSVLEMPVRSLYGAHWSLTGEGAPDYDAPIDADYLPGRNVLLLGVTAVWCALHGVSRIAIGSLLHNPYADATPRFFEGYARLLSEALSHGIEVLAPYRGLHKSDLTREHADLPLEYTLTCVNPQLPPEGSDQVIHCGACIKCRERNDAFVEGGVADRSLYATRPR